jgi:hypothetical protein
MKPLRLLALVALFLPSSLLAQNGSTFTNFIRQVQQPTGVEWDVGVAVTGETLSPLAIDPGGARFELWTVKATPLTSYLLDSRYVGTYVPIAQVVIRSEDPYSIIPRTRADRPFYVDISITGLLSDAGAPAASQSMKFLHHVQAYGPKGTGVGIDRSLATLDSQVMMSENGTQTLTYVINSIAGSDRSKVRGEERFSFFSLADYQAPESQLASQFIQIWPVSDGAIAGITDNQLIRFALPSLTMTVNDVYPGSHVFAQVYKGAPALGTVGTIVPGSSKNFASETVPRDEILPIPTATYDSVFDSDGQWTMELLIETPFGLERLDHVTFMLDRTIEMNGTVTTID